jgi:rRNA-processing protein FCF1
MKVIIDTNALMAMAEFKVDVFAEINRVVDVSYSVIVFSGIIEELEKIKNEEKMKFSRQAKLALSILKAKNVKVIRSSGHVDDALVRYSRKGDLVLTQDLELKKRLRKPYLTIRQKKFVVMVG